MVVIGHQAVGITQPVHALTDRVEYGEESMTVSVMQKDIVPAIAA
jgi:hypothetical protein